MRVGYVLHEISPRAMEVVYVKRMVIKFDHSPQYDTPLLRSSWLRTSVG